MLDITVEICAGDKGEFSLWRDGDKVISKSQLGRFPTAEETAAALTGHSM